MSGTATHESHEAKAARAAAAEALHSYSKTLLQARAAGVSVPAMRLQLLKARGAACGRLLHTRTHSMAQP